MEQQKRQTVVEILKQEAEEQRKDLNAIESMIAYLNNQSASLESLNEPYNAEATYPEKIHYVLKHRGDSFTSEIVAFIKKCEPNLNIKGLSLNVGKAAQRLIKGRVIKVEKVKNSNKYSLV